LVDKLISTKDNKCKKQIKETPPYKYVWRTLQKHSWFKRLNSRAFFRFKIKLTQ